MLPAAAPGVTERLVDARFGPIRRVAAAAVHPHLPQTLHLMTAVLADTTRFAPWRADASGTGAALWDPDAARGAALGEALERYCGNLVPPRLRRATYLELRAAGQDAVDPVDLALYSDAQHAQPGFPFVQFGRDLPVRWVLGESLIDRQPVWVPASLVWVTYPELATSRGESSTNGTIYAGIAAGPGRPAAELSACLELVERDAVALAWHARLPVRPVEPPSWLARLAAGPVGALDTRFGSIPGELGLPVLAAVMVDRVDALLTVGLACHPDPVVAMTKAFVEAAQQQMVVRDLADPDGALGRLARRATGALRPWRADRAYTRSYRTDLRDIVDPGCHLQLYLDVEAQRRFHAEFLSDTAPGPVLERVEAADVGWIARAWAERGIRAVAVDVTTSDVVDSGIRVVRVVAPGLYSNAPAAFPFLGGPRLPAALHGHQPRLLPFPH
ncbi:MAG: YcaO-like family protein [Pseudonocardiales bacterium]